MRTDVAEGFLCCDRNILGADWLVPEPHRYKL